MKKAGMIINIVFIAAFFLVLASGFILLTAHYTPKMELYGYYETKTAELPSEPGEIIRKAGDGTLFSTIESNYNEAYPLRPVAIKINNTIDFLQGKSTNGNVWYGKKGELYEFEYISDCLMLSDKQNGYYNDEKIRGTVEELAYIRDAFRETGKEVYVLITPNKAVFTKEHIPDDLLAQAREEKEGMYTRNVVILKEQLEKNNIPYFDSTAYIQNKLPENVIPFYRSGIHYSWPTGYYIAQAMFRDIEARTGMSMPSFTLDVQNQEEVVFPNHDLYNLMNTLQGITDFVYQDQPQQQVYIDNLQQSPVKTLMQGGSFLGPFIDMYNRYGMFPRFDLIQNGTFISSEHSPIQLQAIEDVDLDQISDDQLYIFEVNEDCASGMSFGFIHYLYESMREDDNTEVKIATALDFGDAKTITQASPHGFYDLEATSLNWHFAAQDFGCTIQDSRIKDRGLIIAAGITDNLRRNAENQEVKVTVSMNGVTAGTYEPDEEGHIFIPVKDLAEIDAPDGIWQIECSVNAYFNPHELNPENPDRRDLSLIVYSISAAAPGRTEE